MKIIFMGTPEFSVRVLQSLIDSEYEIVLVVSQPDKKVGRGQKVAFPPVKKLALENDLEVFQPENINEHLDYIKSFEADFIVTCAYGQFLSNEILACAKTKAINVHASLLPSHRGGAPIHRSILEGDEYTGVSIMEMVEAMDAGDVFVFEKVKIEYEDTLSTLHDKLSVVGAKLLPEAIKKIIADPSCGKAQDHAKATYSPNIAKAERLLDFNDSARNIYNKVRAFNPFPSAYVTFNDSNIKLFEVQETNNKSNKQPGEVVSITKQGVEVCTNDYNILITKLTVPGKSALTALQFYNGNKLISVGNKFN